MGDIKGSPVSNKKKNRDSNKIRFVYLLVGCVIGAVFVFGVLLIFKQEYKLINSIGSDFEEIYTLSIKDLFENKINVANIEEIRGIIGKANKILQNSGRDESEIYKFTENNIQWLFRDNEILVLMPKNRITDDAIEVFVARIEGEIKKDFNISTEIYRNTLISALMPSKNSQFKKSVYYTLDFKNNILLSNNINLIREVIDKVLSTGSFGF